MDEKPLGHRKPLLTKPFIELFLKALRKCHHISSAASACEVSEVSVHKWLRRGEYALRHGLNGPNQIYADFKIAVEKARADRAAGLAERIEAAGYSVENPKGDWRALMAILERADPRNWGGDIAAKIKELERRLKDMEKEGS